MKPRESDRFSSESHGTFSERTDNRGSVYEEAPRGVPTPIEVSGYHDADRAADSRPDV